MKELIRIEGVSKRYRLGTINRGMLVKDLQSWWARRQGKEDPNAKVGEKYSRIENKDEFWALRDISLSINSGDTLAVIGRNGAGKSTLLKILSRTTAPTKGQIKTRGRIASLLEVGTGFHSELTGRENVYLNGAILGMSRIEVQRKFDEIVDFSEIGEFIDTPVKRYSSGMYVRLAFAVAAHLDPEVLVVDEVLAVGDTNFQKKCLGKLNDVNKDGRTVVFVSHNMAMLSSLCSCAVVLDEGRITFPKGGISEAIDFYLGEVAKLTDVPLNERRDRTGIGALRIKYLEIVGPDGNPQGTYLSGQTVEFQIGYECLSKFAFKNIAFNISIYGGHSAFIATLGNEYASEYFEIDKTEGVVRCRLQKLPLCRGTYTLNVIVFENGHIQDWVQEAKILKVENGDFFGTGRTIPETHNGVLFEQEWDLEQYR